ncbi:MAG: hypothetical protein AB7F59_15450, partial [Bdellovibrionales bacterium]
MSEAMKSLLLRQLLLLLLVSQAAFAQEASLTPKFDQWVKNSVRTLEHETTIFNYHSKENVGNIPVTSPDHIATLGKIAGRFFVEPDNGNFAGSGLYFAIDPLVSRNYGGNASSTNWVLTVLTLKKGARYFNIEHPFSREIAKELTEEAQ